METAKRKESITNQVANSLAHWLDLSLSLAPNFVLRVGKSRHSVPIAKQFFTINEKWVLVKFMKALGTFCV